jgi:hypothetical protein
VRDGDGLEASGLVAVEGDGIAAEELVEEGFGLHGGEVNAEAPVGAAAEGVVDTGVLFVFGPFWAES